MNSKRLPQIDLSRPFDHAELMRMLFSLQEAYPFLELGYLTESLLGRPIPILTLGNGRRKLLYVGTHHGMEWITASLLTRFLYEACYAFEGNARVGHLHCRSILEAHTLFVIPMLNPDGAEYQIHGIQKENPLYERLLSMNGDSDFSCWQANARGVDLNHNYDAGFEEYRTLAEAHGITGGAPTRYAGENPESEPETQALCNFLRYHEDMRGVLSLHTQGKEIYYKSGGKALPHTDAIAQRLSKITAYRISEAASLAAYSGLTDWCVSKRGLPCFTLECGEGKNPLPHRNLGGIYADLREALFTLPILL